MAEDGGVSRCSQGGVIGRSRDSVGAVLNRDSHAYFAIVTMHVLDFWRVICHGGERQVQKYYLTGKYCVVYLQVVGSYTYRSNTTHKNKYIQDSSTNPYSFAGRIIPSSHKLCCFKRKTKPEQSGDYDYPGSVPSMDASLAARIFLVLDVLIDRGRIGCNS